jgi:hypothetical protein
MSGVPENQKYYGGFFGASSGSFFDMTAEGISGANNAEAGANSIYMMITHRWRTADPSGPITSDDLVYRSDDWGHTWTLLHTNTQSSLGLAGIVVPRNKPGGVVNSPDASQYVIIIEASSSTYNAGKLWKSNDRGVTFSDEDIPHQGTPSDTFHLGWWMAHRGVSLDDPHHINLNTITHAPNPSDDYADLHVIRTENSGSSWNRPPASAIRFHDSADIDLGAVTIHPVYTNIMVHWFMYDYFTGSPLDPPIRGPIRLTTTDGNGWREIGDIFKDYPDYDGILRDVFFMEH